jgi:opacity protein-like surface antigen
LAALGAVALTSNSKNVAAQSAEPVPSASAAAPEPAAAPYTAWQGTEHAPPPPIPLDAAPAPELAPLEYARRPVELAPEFALGFPSCSDGTEDDSRCDGLGAGLGLGLTALWRAYPYFAFGGTVSGLDFGFHPSARTGLRDTSASGLFYGLLGRVYFSDHGAFEPYLELGLGGGAGRTNARELDDARYTDTSFGGAVRVGLGFEFFLSRHLRIGPAFTWTRFHVSQLSRCAPNEACVALDQDANGHSVGFSTLSARLSILLGEEL